MVNLTLAPSRRISSFLSFTSPKLSELFILFEPSPESLTLYKVIVRRKYNRYVQSKSTLQVVNIIVFR